VASGYRHPQAPLVRAAALPVAEVARPAVAVAVAAAATVAAVGMVEAEVVDLPAERSASFRRVCRTQLAWRYVRLEVVRMRVAAHPRGRSRCAHASRRYLAARSQHMGMRRLCTVEQLVSHPHRIWRMRGIPRHGSSREDNRDNRERY
jgi:hypothetical protein